MSNKQFTIGFIGIGVMGKSMAKHLMDEQYDVHIYTRTKNKAESLINSGAVWHDNVASIAKQANVIITIIGTPKDVEEVYFGDDGIINHAQEGTYLIDMTTSSPKLATEIYHKAKAANMYALDAPVSGGDVGAKNRKLAIMVGGDEEVFNKMLPIFEIMGEKIILQGKAGAGQHTKMVNQITIAPMMLGLAEALSYAEAAELNPELVIDTIATGAAGSWSLSNYAPRILAGDFAPGFAIKHYIKDLKIALDAAEEMNLQLPGLTLALQVYEALAAQGEAENGIHAITKYYKS